jgi:hypothetical protein
MSATTHSRALLILPARGRLWLLLICHGAFASCCALMMAYGGISILPMLAAAFFWATTVIWAVLLLPGNCLVLDTDRFWVQIPYFRFSRHWAEVERFGCVGFGPVKSVCFKLSGDLPRKHPLIRMLLLPDGYDGTIPNVFQVSSYALVSLLADWHSRCFGVPERT